jgi:hypothetical protein
VAGKEQKIRLHKAYGADAVDMEAAAVAQGAEARGVEFGALKAISDAADFSLPLLDRPPDRFVADDGRFRSLKFAGHVALRPWLWRTTIAMARNSSKASQALCGALASYLDREDPDRQTLSDESLAAELNRSKVSPEFAGAHTHAGTEPHTQADGKE